MAGRRTGEESHFRRKGVCERERERRLEAGGEVGLGVEVGEVGLARGGVEEEEEERRWTLRRKRESQTFRQTSGGSGGGRGDTGVLLRDGAERERRRSPELWFGWGVWGWVTKQVTMR